MAERLHPGVYVEEVSSGIRPIEAVGTSTAAFVGEAARGMPGAQFVTSFDEYVRLFGGHAPGDKGLLALAVQAFFAAGGRRAFVVRVLPADAVQGASDDLAARYTPANAKEGAAPNALAFVARGKGAWADALRIEVAKATHFPDEAFKVVVSWVENGTSRVVETFDDVRMDPSHEDYVGEALKSSRYIEVLDRFQEDADSPAPTFASIPEQRPYVTLEELAGTDTYELPEGAELTFQWWDSATDQPVRKSTAKVTSADAGGGKAPEDVAAWLAAAFTADGDHFAVTPTPAQGAGPYAISAKVATRARLLLEVTGGQFDATDWTMSIDESGTAHDIDLTGQTTVTTAAFADLVRAAYPEAKVSVRGNSVIILSQRLTGGAALTFTQTKDQDPPAPITVVSNVAGAQGEVIEDFDALSMTVSEKRKPGVKSLLTELELAAKTRGYEENSPASPRARPALQTGVRVSNGSDGAASSVLGVNDFKGSAAERTGLHALDPEEVNLVGMPGKNTPEYIAAGMEYCDRRGDCFFLVDGPGDTDSKFDISAPEAKQFVEGLPNRSNNAAMYYPWLKISDPVGVGRNPTRYVPPSGHMAGIFARTDNTRGVWKAPAGLEAVVTGALDLQGHALLDADQDLLNPVSLNCLRKFPGAGVVTWGARTLASDPEWRYVPVRRTALFLKESLRRGLRWAVFEPNDQELWDQIASNISAFMLSLFRQGAFQGATPDEAFRVKCDRSTNPQELVDQGIVTAQVAFAPLKPAEFVVIQISQKALVSQ